MTFSERFHEIRTGFERPFWVANISELFERLSYYAVFAVLARYLHESLHFDVERASSLTGCSADGSGFSPLSAERLPTGLASGGRSRSPTCSEHRLFSVGLDRG